MDSAEIKQTIEINGLKVIRKYPSDEKLMSYPQEQLNRNIEAYNSNNELVWVIQEAPQGGENQDKAYMHLEIKNDQIIAGNFIGIDYFVNLNNGTVTPVITGSRPW